MAAKKVTQKEVMWVKAKNGKPGFLALRSDPTKAFSGIVVGIAGSTTKSQGGVARYVNGRNVLKRGMEGERQPRQTTIRKGPSSGTVTSATTSGKAAGRGAGTKGVTSGTVSAAKAQGRKMGRYPKPGEYQPTGIGPSRKAVYTPSGAQPSRRAMSGTVSSAKAGSRPSSRYSSSPTVAAARSKGSKRPAGYKQTRWSQ